jgi:hypothetical protein
MRIHSLEKIEKIKKLRKRGYSINELVEKFSVPKTTIWHHIHKIKVLPLYVPLLNSKRGGSTKRKNEKIRIADEEASELLKGKNRESLIALAMLYWGEGSKGACEFINSNGEIIELYLKVIREVLNIPNKSIKATMRIFTGMDEIECLRYWSKITRIPKKEFIVRFNDGGTRGKTRFGMCRISVRKGDKTLKLMQALIKKVFSNIKSKK